MRAIFGYAELGKKTSVGKKMNKKKKQVNHERLTCTKRKSVGMPDEEEALLKRCC